MKDNSSIDSNDEPLGRRLRNGDKTAASQLGSKGGKVSHSGNRVSKQDNL